VVREEEEEAVEVVAPEEERPGLKGLLAQWDHEDLDE
jgi:hypothetical protein